jgi:hypothetical protein
VDFEAGVAESLASAGSHSFVVDYDPDQGCHLVCVQFDSLPSSFGSKAEEIGLILGDVLHNARAALDYVAWQLARLHLKREPTECESRKIQFPLAKKARYFRRSQVSDYVSSDAFKEMERHQPYLPDPGGINETNTLAILRDLSNSDKHRLPTWAMRYMKIDLSYQFDPPVDGHETEPWAPREEDKTGSLIPGDRLPLYRLVITPEDSAADTSVKVDPQPAVGILLSASNQDYDGSEIKDHRPRRQCRD